MNKYIAVITNFGSAIEKCENLFGIDYIVLYYEDVASVIKDIMEKGRFSLVLIDAVAKAGSELDIINEIRESYLLVHIPVMIVGADGDTEYEKRCFLDWGVVDFMPYSSISLLMGLHAAVHIQWFEWAFKDQLTHLYNRHYYSSIIGRVSKFSFDNKFPISICMIDIDYFKQFNDTYGHEEGNRAIESVADAIQKSVPAEGIAARYGGDEFIVILPNIDAVEAKKIANSIVEAVRKLKIEHMNRKDSKKVVTVSIGAVTGYATSDVNDFSKIFIDKADANLYKAKGEGLEDKEALENTNKRDRYVHEIFVPKEFAEIL